MSVPDNPATILALSALGGSAIGALTSTVGAWIGQRHRERGTSDRHHCQNLLRAKPHSR